MISSVFEIIENEALTPTTLTNPNPDQTRPAAALRRQGEAERLAVQRPVREDSVDREDDRRNR